MGAIGVLGNLTGAASDAGVEYALLHGNASLASLINQTGYWAGASLTFLEQNPSEAAAAYLAGIATVTLLGPGVLAVAGADLAGTALMEGVASLVGQEAVTIASNVIVSQFAGLTGEAAYTALYNIQSKILQGLGATSTDTANSQGGSYSIVNSAAGPLQGFSWPQFTLTTSKITETLSGGNSQITTYNPDGSSVTTTYSGPNGTGSVTGASIANASANIVCQVTGATYAYTGNELYGGVQGSGNYTQPEGRVTATATVVDSNGITSGFPDLTSFSLSALGQTFLGTSGSITIVNGKVTQWDLEIVNGADAILTGNENSTELVADSAFNFATNLVGNNTNDPGTWTEVSSTCAVTVSALAGKTQQLSSVLSNPSLTAQGAIQNLTINGPGIVGVTGSYNLPTVVDNGTIAIASGASFQVSSRLVEDAGSAITGVVAGAGASTTIELAAGKSGSISSGLSNIGTIDVDAGATWTVTGSYSLPSIVDNGTIAMTDGASLAIFSALDPSSSGIFQLEGKSSLEIAKALGASSKIQFLGSAPTNKLIIDSAANFGTNVGKASYAGPLLENFAAGDTIDLKGIVSTGLKLAYSTTGENGDLQITGSSGNAVATLAFLNSTLGAGTFHAASDGTGGTLITHS